MSGHSPRADPTRAQQPADSALRSRIESVGTYLPEGRLTSADLVASCRQSIDLDLEALTGIRARRVCGEGEDSFTLARSAAQDCLDRSRHDATDLEMIISCSITRFDGPNSFVFEPALSLHLKHELGVPSALNFDVSNACAGMVTGVMILDDFIRRGVVRRGMVVSGESTASLWRNAAETIDDVSSDQLASLTIGDAGAAVILERAENGSPGIRSCELVTLAEHRDLCIGKPYPDGPGAAMYTDAKKLHQVAISSFPPVGARALERAGVAWSELKLAIPHQSSSRAIKAGEVLFKRVLGDADAWAVDNLEERGNTASTTHFVALRRLLDEGTLDPGDHVMLMAFASGVVIGALVFTVDHLVENRARTH